MRDLAHEHPLAVLAAFSNEDKHRNLVASAVLATSVRFKLRHTAPKPFVITGYEFHGWDDDWLYDGASIGTLVISEGSIGYEDVEVQPTFEGTIAFRAKGAEPVVSVAALEEVLDAIHSQIVAPLDAILCR